VSADRITVDISVEYDPRPLWRCLLYMRAIRWASRPWQYEADVVARHRVIFGRLASWRRRRQLERGRRLHGWHRTP